MKIELPVMLSCHCIGDRDQTTVSARSRRSSETPQVLWHLIFFRRETWCWNLMRLNPACVTCRYSIICSSSQYLTEHSNYCLTVLNPCSCFRVDARWQWHGRGRLSPGLHVNEELSRHVSGYIHAQLTRSVSHCYQVCVATNTSSSPTSGSKMYGQLFC